MTGWRRRRALTYARRMWIETRAALTSERRATLSAVVAPFSSLQDLVRWGFAQRPPLDVQAVIIQDEFSHDVVLPWTDGLFLAFDTT